MEVSVTVNGANQTHDVEPRTLLVHYLRDTCGLTGTNIGCDTSSCGACTVHLNGESVKSCTVFAAQADGMEITTIEGLASEAKLSIVQQAWIDEQVPQCGYCQSGVIMAASALLASTANPSDAEIDSTITNICRCGTYSRIRSAIHRAAKQLAEVPGDDS